MGIKTLTENLTVTAIQGVTASIETANGVLRGVLINPSVGTATPDSTFVIAIRNNDVQIFSNTSGSATASRLEFPGKEMPGSGVTASFIQYPVSGKVDINLSGTRTSSVVDVSLLLED